MDERISCFYRNQEWLSAIEQSFPRDGNINLGVELKNGILPMVLEHFDIETRSTTALRFSGVYMSDYLDFDGAESISAEDIAIIVNKARELGAGFIWLSNIPIDSAIHERMEEYSKQHEVLFLKCLPTLGVRCEDTFDDYVAALSKNTRRNIRRKSKAVDELGASFEIKRATRDLLASFIDLQDKRAKAKNLDSIAENDEVDTFVKLLIEVGGIYIADLSIRDESVSKLLLLIGNGAIGIFMQGFDPKWSRFSPSFVNITKLIRYAHENGFSYIDFLRGDEEYKKQFANFRIDMEKCIIIIDKNVMPVQIRRFVDHYEE